MKSCLVTILCLWTCITQASVYNKLATVNAGWQTEDIADLQLPTDKERTETEWIQLHLLLVEQVLRNRNTAALTPSQAANRAKALDHLHEYWQKGSFPQNEDYSYRTPIFIDKHNTFCAVGYLIKATGYEHVSRMVSANTNLAYVKEMHFPELQAWAQEYGFTVDELAWIQPGYPPKYQLNIIGNGTNGYVNDLFVDTATKRMYIGGSFSFVDDTVFSPNIVYVTEDTTIGYTWHKMYSSFNGAVTAITKYGSDLFVAGNFTRSGTGIGFDHIAKWDGSNWSAAGCINGSIKNMAVYQNELYAVGSFSNCSGNPNKNFAKWDGTNWQIIPGLAGSVNTIEVLDTVLYLGGLFSYMGNDANAIKWNATYGFMPFANTPPNEVNDFAMRTDTMYIGCALTSNEDTNIVMHLENNTWVKSFNYVNDYLGFYSYSVTNRLSINSLIDDDYLYVAGDFSNVSGMHPVANFTRSDAYGSSFSEYMYLTGVVNKMTMFNNKLILGGAFPGGVGKRVPGSYPFNWYYKISSNSTPACLNLNNGSAVVHAIGNAPFKYLWSNGSTDSTVHNLAAGIYTVVVTDKEYVRQYDTVTIVKLFEKTPLFDNATKKLEISTTIPSLEYQWLDCDNNNTVTLSSANFGKYSIIKNGRYACIVKYGGCTDTSDCIYAELYPADIAETTTKNNISLYPNPVTDKLHISLNAGTIKDLKIMDITGRIFIAKNNLKTNEVDLNTSQLAGGYYTITITQTDNKKQQFKLVKQ